MFVCKQTVGSVMIREIMTPQKMTCHVIIMISIACLLLENKG